MWFFPTLAGQLADQVPELAWLRWPLLAVVIVVIFGAELAVVAVWRLLDLTQRDRVFSTAAYGWVDVIAICSATDAAMMLGVNLFLAYGIHANPPSLGLLLLALTVAGAALALLMIVMKGLLRQAVGLKDALDEVV